MLENTERAIKKMDNTEKLATLGTQEQDEDKYHPPPKKKHTHTAMRKQTQIW